jgi:hypothetical protein
MLRRAGTDSQLFPPTILFNEGWMLRLVLAAHEKGINCLPFPLLPGSSWYSEARMPSKFLRRFGGDRLAEAWTRADGIVGRFEFVGGTKAGIRLAPDARQLVVIEAKMFSPLSPGTKNLPLYDQVTRAVACMATLVGDCGKPIESYESLGFYVLAPRKQIVAGAFTKELDMEKINGKVESRIELYRSDPRYDELGRWYETTFLPLLSMIEVQEVSWEDVIEKIEGINPSLGTSVRSFYDSCRLYSGRKTKSPTASGS